MPQNRWQGRGAGAASGASKQASDKETEESKKRKAVKAQKEVAKMNKCHRGGGAWILLGLDSDSDSCQGQSSEGESAASDPPRCDAFESGLDDAVNDDAREEHDLSCPDGDGAEVEEHGADGHGRTAGGVQAPHGVGSDACSSIGPVLIGPQDMPHAVTHAQYVLAAKPLFQGSTCPPRLHCAAEYGLKAAAFAMPDWNEDTKGIVVPGVISKHDCILHIPNQTLNRGNGPLMIMMAMFEWSRPMYRVGATRRRNRHVHPMSSFVVVSRER